MHAAPNPAPDQRRGVGRSRLDHLIQRGLMRYANIESTSASPEDLSATTVGNSSSSSDISSPPALSALWR